MLKFLLYIAKILDLKNKLFYHLKRYLSVLFAMNEGEVHKVVVVGSGPAAYSASIYLARAMLKPLLISGYDAGGQLMLTTEVENYPGFSSIKGPELMGKMREQAENVGTEIMEDFVDKIDFRERPFILYTLQEKQIKALNVIIATGAQAKWLGLESEKHFQGYGVSGCATCDGFFFKDKKVIVVGGGNTAAEEALFLTNFASKVTLIHRGGKLRSEQVTYEKLKKNSKINILFNTTLEEVLGVESPQKSVTGARLKTLEKSYNVEVDGIFIAIGHEPATSFLQNSGLELDDEGYIKVKAGTTQTNIAGVYGAGDVADRIYRQAVTAAGFGCMASLDLIKNLK
jgi:thioredoxin reductase (NADPH)